MPTAGTMPVRPTERRPSHRNRCRIRQGSGKPHPSVLRTTTDPVCRQCRHFKPRAVPPSKEVS